MINHSKLKYLIVILIGALVILISYYFYYTQQKKVEIKDFRGSVVSINGDTVTLLGSYIASSTLPIDIQGQKTFSFVVDSETKITKTEQNFPDWSKLGTSGVIKLKDLPAENSNSSLSDLEAALGNTKNSTTVDVHFDSSIYKISMPKALSINYKVLVMPN